MGKVRDILSFCLAFTFAALSMLSLNFLLELFLTDLIRGIVLILIYLLILIFTLKEIRELHNHNKEGGKEK